VPPRSSPDPRATCSWIGVSRGVSSTGSEAPGDTSPTKVVDNLQNNDYCRPTGVVARHGGGIMEVILHDRELDLMEVLWERGSATAAEVRAALKDDLAYNTVLTILRRMEDKGYLRHEEEGRAHRYFPL